MSSHRYSSIGGASCASKGVAGHERPAATEAKVEITKKSATPNRELRRSLLLSGCASGDGGCSTPSRSMPRFKRRISQQTENRLARGAVGSVVYRSFAEAFRVTLSFSRQPTCAGRPGTTAAGLKRYRHSPGQHRMGRTPAACIRRSPLRLALDDFQSAHPDTKCRGVVAAGPNKQRGRQV